MLDAQVGRHVPGVSLVVASSDGVLSETSRGVVDVATGGEMTSGTTMNWFSMTKLVTATAAVQLADRHLLDLDAPVEQYYEPFAAMRPEGRAHSVTVRHLLSHSAGVVNPLPLRWIHLASEEGPQRAELVATLLSKHRRLRFEAGEKAVYTNLGYLVLGEVIASASGQPFEEFVRANVLEPLGMGSTGFMVPPGAAWATPHQKRFTPLSVLMPVLIPRKHLRSKEARFVALHPFYVDGAAYGGLVGPPTDAIRFARAHLRGGELDGHRILSEAACRGMQTMITRGRKLEVGLGWFRRGTPSQSDNFVEHLGGGVGFWNCLRIYPARGLAAVVMGNATTYDHDAIIRAATGAAT